MATLTRYRPFRPMSSLRRELDQLLGDVIPSFGEEEFEGATAVWSPRMDLTETENEFLVRMDLPGIDRKDVKINVEDHRLSISGERKEEVKEEKKNFLRMERSYGSFYRAFDLPGAVREDDVKAEMADGVLTIHLPKTEISKPRQIQIS